MSLNNSIDDLQVDLASVYTEGKFAYIRDHATSPRPSLNETSRSEALQTAYFAQGRQPLAEINRLRKLAGQPAIGAAEGKLKITKARYGQSAHNFLPARALDIKFLDEHGNYVQDEKPYRDFAKYMLAAATELGIQITWGGTFNDLPHFECRNWRTMK